MLTKIPDFVTKPNIYLPGNHKSYVVLDFETTYNEFDPSAVSGNEIVLACWTIVKGDGTETKKHCFANSLYQTELVEDCLAADFVVAHNSKFEAGYLQMCGVDLRKILMYCTMLGEWVIYGNLKVDKTLQGTAARYMLGTKRDLVNSLIKKGVCCSTIPEGMLLDYCERDVELTLKIFRLQVERLHKTQRLHLVHTRNLAAIALADIEMQGMQLDANAVIKEYEYTLRRRNWLRRELNLLTNNINLGSPKQVGELIYDVLEFEELKDRHGPIRTASGNRGTDSKVIEKLVPKTENQKRFLEMYREFNRMDSLLTKNLDYFYRTVKEREGKFHAKFQQGVTATHRLSSAGIPTLFIGEKNTKSVQFQNLPRIYKKLFWSGDDDWLVGECDGAQLEFRVAADIGHDRIAYKEIVEDADIHTVTAETLTAAGEPTTRQNAKASTFAPLFGGMGKTPAQKAYAEFFKKKYKDIADTQAGWCYTVGAKKYLILPWKMRLFFPEASVNRHGRLNVLTNVSNYPIQSLATAEIIPIALVYFWYRTAGTRIIIQNTIHDSIVVKLHKSEVERFEQLSKQCLTEDVFNHLRDVYHYNFKVPLGVGIKVGRNWGQSPEEVIYSTMPDGSFTRKVKT